MPPLALKMKKEWVHGIVAATVYKLAVFLFLYIQFCGETFLVGSKIAKTAKKIPAKVLPHTVYN